MPLKRFCLVFLGLLTEGFGKVFVLGHDSLSRVEILSLPHSRPELASRPTDSAPAEQMACLVLCGLYLWHCVYEHGVAQSKGSASAAIWG